jgi:hypothetical protein
VWSGCTHGPDATLVALAIGGTAILQRHRLPLLHDLHSNLAVVAVIFWQNDSAAPG